MGNIQTAQALQESQISAKKPVTDIIDTPAKTRRLLLTKSDGGNFEVQRASELACRELEAQGSQKHVTQRNVPSVDSIIPGIQEVNNYLKNHKTTFHEMHPKVQDKIGSEKESSKNSFVYYTPNGTRVNMAKGHVYDKTESHNNNIVCSTQTMMALSSEPILKPHCNPKKSLPVVVDLTGDDSNDESEDADRKNPSFPKIVATFSLNSQNSPFIMKDLSGILAEKTNNVHLKNGHLVNGAINDYKTDAKKASRNRNVFDLRDELMTEKRRETSTELMEGMLSNIIDDVIGEMKDDTVPVIKDDVISSRHDAMGDVTNLRNDVINARKSDVGAKRLVEQEQVLEENNNTAKCYAAFSSWSVKEGDEIMEISRPFNPSRTNKSTESAPVSKQVSTEEKRGRSTHHRKAVHEVRTSYLDKVTQKEQGSTEEKRDRTTHPRKAVHEVRTFSLDKVIKKQQDRSTHPRKAVHEVRTFSLDKVTKKQQDRSTHPRKAVHEIRTSYLDKVTKKEQGSTEEKRDRTTHPRKAVHEVRTFLLDKETQKRLETLIGYDKTHLQGVTRPSGGVGMSGTPWTLKIISTKSGATCQTERETKIKKLKNLLLKQEQAVEKLRVNGHTIPENSFKPYLVVKIPDLNTQLQTLDVGKRSFRVLKASNGITRKDDIPLKRKPRKLPPRKLNPGYTYPSYVTPKDLVAKKNKRKGCERAVDSNSPIQWESFDDDKIDEEDVRYEPSVKRARGRQRGEKGTKPRSSRRKRGRHSPIDVAVVTKDNWHTELERVENAMALSDKPLDQDSFLLFLGLKRV